MSITRLSLFTGDSLYQDEEGAYVRHCDYLKAVESLEYDIRYANEQLSETQDELKYYKELYFALAEQQSY